LRHAAECHSAGVDAAPPSHKEALAIKFISFTAFIILVPGVDKPSNTPEDVRGNTQTRIGHHSVYRSFAQSPPEFLTINYLSSQTKKHATESLEREQSSPRRLHDLMECPNLDNPERLKVQI
jgi:hypothetical protein